FIIEVMGRDAGYIALHSGIATGAENILIPERKTDIEDLIASLQEKERRKKLVNLIVVAEGDEFGGADEVAKAVKERLPQTETRVCILGHIQRGGAPTCLDRLIASRMGYHAVESLIQGRHNVFVGILNNKMNYVPLENVGKRKGTISDEWMKIVKILAS
ncbi:MAG TPA: 6-phosphofructokinase, partial [Flavisolibacter sp.]|nr:6-phosphofructokinase [Flavisolibacter sp.]